MSVLITLLIYFLVLTNWIFQYNKCLQSGKALKLPEFFQIIDFVPSQIQILQVNQRSCEPVEFLNVIVSQVQDLQIDQVAQVFAYDCIDFVLCLWKYYKNVLN